MDSLKFFFQKILNLSKSWEQVGNVTYKFSTVAIGLGYDLSENLQQKIRVCDLITSHPQNSPQITDRYSSILYAYDEV